ncbi:MAG: type II toxin-antitoxin system VapC family toxin [Coriobacteriia bacterium]
MNGAAPVVVVDASIGVKWAVTEREDGVADAMWLLERHARGDIVLAVPGTFRLEWLNALVSRGLAVPDVLDAARDLERSALCWYEIDETLSFEAVALASAHSLTVSDAAYLALANRLDAGLVTADVALAHAAGDRLVHVVDFKPES